MGITAYDVRVIADGLLLGKILYGDVNRDTVEKILKDPIHVASLPTAPDWVYVKRYIEHHPGFVDDSQRRRWWRHSDKSVNDRKRLVRAFAESVCGNAPDSFTLLTPRLLRNNGEVNERIHQRFERVSEILNDGARRPSEKRSALVSLLGKQHRT